MRKLGNLSGRVLGHFVSVCLYLQASISAATTTSTVTTLTLPEEYPWPANQIFETDGECGHAPIPANSPLELLPAGGLILFVGDSFTVRANNPACGYGTILTKLIATTFERYCGTGSDGLQVPAYSGKDGAFTYKPADQNKSRLQRGVEDAHPDLVISEDAGEATELSGNQSDSDYFPAHVNNAVQAALAVPDFVRPTPSQPGQPKAGSIVLVTTAPFEAIGRSSISRTGNCHFYANACNWVGHNRVLAECVEEQVGFPPGDPTRRVFLGDIARYFCHASSDGRPSFALTRDGIHPSNNGHFLYALALFKALGGKASDVTPQALLDLRDGACEPARGPQPTLGSLREIHRLVFSTSETLGDSCLLDPGCTDNYEPGTRASHCIDFCSGDPVDHQCSPYFPCSAIPIDRNAPCDDGEFCTGVGDCVAGVCVSGEDLPPTKSCDDANVCTDEGHCDGLGSCESGSARLETTPCDDEEDCTIGDHCNGAGGCTGGEPLAETVDCDDDNACTGAGHCNGQGSCVAGQPLLPATSCDDESPCTANDHCSGDGTCTGSAQGTQACHDGNACTLDDRCDGFGVCGGLPKSCSSDFLYCNGPESCSNGECYSSGDPCVGPDGDDDCSESCDEIGGTCSAADPDHSGCTDGSFCNGTDTCSEGGCTSHAGSPCSGPDGDGDCSESCDEEADACTADDSNGSTCDDGIFCNGVDYCAFGGCEQHEGDPCPGPDADSNCSESCDEIAGDCGSADPSDSQCDDAQHCNGVDSCESGLCLPDAVAPCAPTGECLARSCEEEDPAAYQCGTSFLGAGAECQCSQNDPCISSCGGTCTDRGTCGAADLCPVCTGLRAHCKTLGDLSLDIHSEVEGEDTIRIRANNGAAATSAELGDVGMNGFDDDALTVCVYAETGQVIWYGALPKNECQTGSCWKRSVGSETLRLKYQNRSVSAEFANSAGIADFSLRAVAGNRDKSSLRLFAHGTAITGLPENLAIEPDSEVERTFTVQMVSTSSSGNCWQRDVAGEASHSTASGISDFRGKAHR